METLIRLMEMNINALGSNVKEDEVWDSMLSVRAIIAESKKRKSVCLRWSDCFRKDIFDLRVNGPVLLSTLWKSCFEDSNHSFARSLKSCMPSLKKLWIQQQKQHFFLVGPFRGKIIHSLTYSFTLIFIPSHTWILLKIMIFNVIYPCRFGLSRYSGWWLLKIGSIQDSGTDEKVCWSRNLLARNGG